MCRRLLIPMLFLLALPASAKVQWVEPPPKERSVSKTFEIVRWRGEHGYATEDTAVAILRSDSLEGEWHFRGGDYRRAPTSYLRLWGKAGSNDVLASFACEDAEANCAALRARAEHQAEDRALTGAMWPPPPPPPPPPMPPPPPDAPPQPPSAVMPLSFDVHTDPTCQLCGPPIYPRVPLEAGIGGTVELLLTYDVDGYVRGAEVALSSGNAELDAAAKAAVLGWKLQPATINGANVAGQVKVPVKFVPELGPTSSGAGGG